MRKLLISTFALVILSPVAANADPIVNTGLCADGEDTCYTSIEDLIVGGIAYDVNWYSTPRTLDDHLISDPGVELFVGNRTLALEAARAINDVFDSDGRKLLTIDLGTTGFAGLYVVSDYRETGFFPIFDAYVPFSTRDSVARVRDRASATVVPYAIFTRATAVPEPGTLALLGAGLIGMGFARRGKKTNAERLG